MLNFWNGNKSTARQKYEFELLELFLNKAQQKQEINNDLTHYPAAEDEGNVLDNGADLLVTIAGNQKFHNKQFIEIKKPLCQGLLGQRVLIIPKNKESEFAHISLEKLKQHCVGVPNTWVDAELFRQNGFKVLEKGNLEEMLVWLSQGEVDYLTLGITEAKDILAQFSTLSTNLLIESTMLLTYPFPVVFYVNQEQNKLAQTIELGINKAFIDGSFQLLFDRHFKQTLDEMKLENRQKLELVNPLLPAHYQ